MSWAPGEPVRFEIPHLAVYDMHPEGTSLGPSRGTFVLMADPSGA